MLLSDRIAKRRGMILEEKFYLSSPDEVARRLLGKILVRRLGNSIISGIIVEDEAYFGINDPASRARKGGDLRKTMYGNVGIALIYGIHRQWMFNVVAHNPFEGGAVLIRALEPLEGTELMKKFRKAKRVEELTSGPGRLTQALSINKSFHKKPLYVKAYGLWIEDGGIQLDKSEIFKSHRIGVSKDLSEPYRFGVKGSPYISKKLLE